MKSIYIGHNLLFVVLIVSFLCVSPAAETVETEYKETRQLLFSCADANVVTTRVFGYSYGQ